MKVLIFVNQFYRLGGAEGLAVQLAERLNRRGIHADLLSMYSSNLPGVMESARTIFESGVPSIRYLGLKIHPGMFDAVSAISRLRRLIRNENYDVVETSMPTPTMLACLATLGLETRVVAGLHAAFVKELWNRVQDRMWQLAVRVNKRARFYAISQNVANHWVQYSETSPHRTQIIYNAITDDYFDNIDTREEVRRELGIPQESRIALFVGRLVKSKGIDTVLEALESFLRNGQLYLLYVGGERPPEGFLADEVGLLDRLRAKIADQVWSDRVKFLGTRPDVDRLMRAADVLVHPAHKEGFGLVLAEALASGLPIVASNVEGIPEVLAGTDSILLPPDQPILFRQAIGQILDWSPEKRREAVSKGRARAESFRMERRVDELVEMFTESLVEKRRAA